jgi:hypothetical protein
LSAELERTLERELRGEGQPPVAVHAPSSAVVPAHTVVHCFDTAERDLSKAGHVLELRESPEGLLVVAGRADDDTSRAQVQIDGAWALQILSGQVSPVVILDRRLGKPGPRAVQEIRVVVGRRQLCRIDSRMTNLSAPSSRHITPEALRVAAG